MNERTLEFNCYRVYDMKRYTANPKTDAFVVGYHLQKMEDTHTLCGYKTDTNKLRGRWALSSLSYFADEMGERDTICFRCLRIWSLKNQIQYPRPWMVDRLKKAKKVVMRGENNE